MRAGSCLRLASLDRDAVHNRYRDGGFFGPVLEFFVWRAYFDFA